MRSVLIFILAVTLLVRVHANEPCSSIFTAPLGEQIKGAEFIFIGKIVSEGLMSCTVQVIEQYKGALDEEIIPVADFNTDSSFLASTGDSSYKYMPYDGDYVLKKDSLYFFFISGYNPTNGFFEVSGAPSCGVFRVDGDLIEYEANNFCGNGIGHDFGFGEPIFLPLSDFEELLSIVLEYDAKNYIDSKYIGKIWEGLSQAVEQRGVYPIRHFLAVLDMLDSLKYDPVIDEIIRYGSDNDKLILAEYIGLSPYGADKDLIKVLKTLTDPKEDESVRLTALLSLKELQSRE